MAAPADLQRDRRSRLVATAGAVLVGAVRRISARYVSGRPVIHPRPVRMRGVPGMFKPATPELFTGRVTVAIQVSDQTRRAAWREPCAR